MNIFIILSTYNGSSYIREQIQSIRDQSYDQWKLLIRDDGSTDNTREIIQEFVDSDKRITFFDKYPGNLGALKSFNILANQALKLNADYLLFSDQDDVWEPWKINESLELVQKTEKASPKDTPVLVHTDLQVVDENMDPIDDSYLKYQHMRNESRDAMKVLLSQNYITGCSMMANKPLILIAQPIADSIIMHDWWYGLCASTTGKIAYIDKPSIKYRQHMANIYGSIGFTNMILSEGRLRSFLSRKKSNYLVSYIQDHALRDRLSATKYSKSRNFAILEKYCSMGKLSGIQRVFLAMKLGLHQQGILRNMYFYYSLLFTKPFNPGD